MYRRVFSNVYSRYPPDTNSTPRCDNQKCLSPLPSVFWGAKSPPVENREAVSTKNYWAQNVNSAKVKKSHSILVFFKLQDMAHW